MKEIVFWGATGQAKVLRECLSGSDFELIALFDNNEKLLSPFLDVPLYFGKKGFEKWITSRTRTAPIGFLVTIGGLRGRDRVEIQDYLESFDLVPLIAKHRTAFVADNVKIGLGSQILAHSAICVEAVIGRACIVNTNASVEHECRLQDGVHVAPGAHLAGCVELGRNTTIGVGAIVLPRIGIGEGAVVGAGAVVTKDVAPYTVVIGNPAKVFKTLEG